MEKTLDWNIEKLWNIYGTFVEKQIWRIYGDLTRWNITDWKNQRRVKINTQVLRELKCTRNQLNGWKNVSENCRLGKH